MRKFNIKVNGNAYEVEVEEIMDDSVATKTENYVKIENPVPKFQPVLDKPIQTNNVEKPTIPVPQGANTINSPMPGTIIKVNINAGDSVKKGQILLILEAMKMENEIVATTDGKVASVNVSKGDSVSVGDVLVSIA